MELKHLRHFITVVEEGGITAAARKLALTQSALSRQIQALEADLGVALLHRGARSFALTPAAEALAADGRKLLDQHDRMVERIRALGAGKLLRIGYSPSLAGDFLPQAIERYSQLHPGLRVSLQDASTVSMLQSLAEEKLDVVVTVPCGGTDGVEWVPLRRYGWRVAMHVNHSLAAKTMLAPGDLEGVKLLLYERSQYPDYWSRITAFFRAAKLQAKVAGEFDGVSSLLAAVEANLGVAVLSESTRVAGPRIVMRPLSVQPEPIEVAAGISSHDVAPAHLRAFIEELRQPDPG